MAGHRGIACLPHSAFVVICVSELSVLGCARIRVLEVQCECEFLFSASEAPNDNNTASGALHATLAPTLGPLISRLNQSSTRCPQLAGITPDGCSRRRPQIR